MLIEVCATASLRTSTLPLSRTLTTRPSTMVAAMPPPPTPPPTTSLPSTPLLVRVPHPSSSSSPLPYPPELSDAAIDAAVDVTARAYDLTVTRHAATTTPDQILNAHRVPEDSAVLILDLRTLAERLRIFHRALPSVELHYAVKVFCNAPTVAFLTQLGASFDCASRHELQLVAAAIERFAPHTRVEDRVVFANPVKMPQHLAAARAVGAHMVTVDSVEELAKLATHLPRARVLVRLAVDDSRSLYKLSGKFGAFPHEVRAIAAAARDCGVAVCGVAFHAGSYVASVDTYVHAIRDARAAFDTLVAEGFAPDVLDIGGGFPGRDDDSLLPFDLIAAAVRDALATYFPSGSARVIAEPGMFVAEACGTLGARVLHAVPSPTRYSYYVASSVFSMFRYNRTGSDRFPPRALTARDFGRRAMCQLYGSTFEACDIIGDEVELPVLEEGDWIWFANMAAYTWAVASPARVDAVKPRVVYVYREPDDQGTEGRAAVSTCECADGGEYGAR